MSSARHAGTSRQWPGSTTSTTAHLSIHVRNPSLRRRSGRHHREAEADHGGDTRPLPAPLVGEGDQRVGQHRQQPARGECRQSIAGHRARLVRGEVAERGGNAGETAPLLIIAGSTDSLNLNLFGDRMMTLPVFIYYSYMQPGVPPEFGQARAWGAALVLIVIVMALNLLARAIGRHFAPKTGR